MAVFVWVVYSEDGDIAGVYSTEDAAQRRKFELNNEYPMYMSIRKQIDL